MDENHRMNEQNIIEYFGFPPIKYLYDGGNLYFSSYYENSNLFIGTTAVGTGNPAVAKLLSELYGKAMKEHPDMHNIVVFHDWSRVTEVEGLAEILLILTRLIDRIGKRHGDVVVYTSLRKGPMMKATIKAAFYLAGHKYYLEETEEAYLNSVERTQKKYLKSK